MNFQATIGMLLISLGVVLICIVFGPKFIKALDAMDQPSIRTGVKESPPRVIRLTQKESRGQQHFAATIQAPTSRHRPVATSSSVSLDLTPAIPATPVQANLNQTKTVPVSMNRFHENSSYQALEQAKPVPQDSISQDPVPKAPLPIELPNLVEAPKTAGSSISEPPAPIHSAQKVQELQAVQQETKSPLEHHYSAPQEKFIRNRYVDANSRRNTRPQPVERTEPAGMQLKKRSSLLVERVKAPNDHSQQPAVVRPANYESRVSQAKSVRVIESTSPESEDRSVYHPNHRLAQAGTAIAPTKAGQLRFNPQVEVRAREHIEYGESLARRNSYLAAREEFTLALLLIARSYNAQSDSNTYSERLNQGLTALDEAADFVGPNNTRSQDSVLQLKVRSHKTRLVSENDIGRISRTKALDHYCGFAQSQIQQAIGHSAAGSAALHALGKIESRPSVRNRRGDWTGQARALVFFRAAMSCDPANAVCANDLGVLLHGMGRLKEAEQSLKVSLGSSPTRLGWVNLAAVHSQLASTADVVEEREKQLRLARLAAMEAENFGSNAPSNGIAGEQWATMNEFHNNAAFPNVTMQPVPENRQQVSSQTKVSRAETLLQKVKGWY